MRVIISAGGTGGHIYPAMAVVNKIKDMEPNSDILYIGTHNRMEKDIVPNYDINYLPLKVTGFKRKLSLYNVHSVIYFFKAIKEAKKVIRDFKPDVVVGFGGYVTAPVLYAAHKLGVPTFVHEQNSVVGLTNRFLARFVNKVGVSFENTITKFKPDQAVFTGNPLGEQALKVKAAKRTDYFDNNNPIVLLSMGSLGSGSVNKVIVELIPKLKDQPYNFIWVTGTNAYADYKNIKAPGNVLITSFIKDMVKVIKISDVFITRAGAGALAEIGVLGIPSIIIPSPYVTNNHQVMNAKSLADANAALVLQEDELNSDKLIEMIDEVLYEDTLRKRLIRNVKRTGVRNSATLIYEQLLKIRKK